MLDRMSVGWAKSPNVEHLGCTRLQWAEVAFLSPCHSRGSDGKDTGLGGGKLGFLLSGASVCRNPKQVGWPLWTSVSASIRAGPLARGLGRQAVIAVSAT